MSCGCGASCAPRKGAPTCLPRRQNSVRSPLNARPVFGMIGQHVEATPFEAGDVTRRGYRMPADVRKRVMASIHKRDTKPELALRRAMWSTGVRGWRCHARLPGTPDVAFTRWKLAVFVDGVWWHGHPAYLPRGRRGRYWDQKIAGNMARDRRADQEPKNLGWAVLRFWDLEVLADPESAVAAIVKTLGGLGWRRPQRSPVRAPRLPNGRPLGWRNHGAK